MPHSLGTHNMKRIVYNRPQGALDEFDKGGITVVIPSPEYAELIEFIESEGGQLTKDDVLNLLKSSIPPWAQDVRVVDESELPTDRHFRDAWKWDGDAIKPDIERAREITKDKLRLERAPLFQELDVQFYKAMERGEDTTPIVAEKNRLRNITAAVDNETSLENLKAMRAAK